MAKITDVNKLVKIEQDGDKQRVICASSLICSVFDVSRMTLSEWVGKGCPKVKNGWYDIHAVIEWKYGSDTTSDNAQDDMSAQAKKAIHEAEIKRIKAEADKIELDKLKGKVIYKDEIETMLSSRAAELKKGLTFMVGEVASQIPEYETRKFVKKLMNEQLYKLLDSYARTGSYGDDEDD